MGIISKKKKEKLHYFKACIGELSYSILINNHNIFYSNTINNNLVTIQII